MDRAECEALASAFSWSSLRGIYMSMQTEFRLDRERALVGQKADAMPAAVVSVTSNEPTPIPFGALVLFDDKDPFLCKLPARESPLDKPVGITVRQFHCENYQPKSSIAAMRKGRVWVCSEKVESPGDAVCIKFLEDGSYTFTGAKEGSVQLKGAIFLEKSDGGKVPIEVDFFGGAR
jgi:hypothetical protein